MDNSSSNAKKSSLLTKEERIAARRARILARRQQKDDVVKQVVTPEERDALRLPKAHIIECRNALDVQREEADDEVGTICTNSDERYQLVQDSWEDEQVSRRQRVSTVLKDTNEANETIQNRWKVLRDMSDPQEMYKGVQKQQEKCTALVSRRDEIIKSLQDDIKQKDVEYDETLQQQAADITMLIETMRRQFNELLQSHGQYLEEIEHKYKEEREDMLSKNAEQLNMLFQKRREIELRMMENKQSQQESFQDELTAIRARDAEEYNNLKIVLENNIQLLEQQLQEMRATYQLNSEKLDYNHRVLKERDLENKQTVLHHKQKLKRLKEALSTTMARHSKLEEQYRGENQELTDDFRRMTAQFKEMQRKYRHFQLLDTQKYREVWEMNEETVMELVHKALKADRIIHEEILGRTWNPPSLPRNVLSSIHPLSVNHDGNDRPRNPSHERGGGGDDRGAHTPHSGGRFTNAQVRKVMLLLASEVSFVVAEKLRQVINTLPEEEQAMYLVDGILTALGVVDRDDLEELVGKFYDDENAQEPTIASNGVVAMLKEFTAVRHGQSSRLDDPSVNTGDTNGATATTTATNNSSDADERSRHREGSSQKGKKKQRQENGYWHALGSVIPDEDLRLWNAVEKRLLEYNRLLQERCDDIEETVQLADENAQLRSTLETYLSHPQNDDLQIPPNRLLRVNQ